MRNKKKNAKFLCGIAIVFGLIILFALKGTITIELPFTETEILHIEMYHYEGVPSAEECKIITGREDVKTLYNELQKMKVRTIKKDSDSMTGGSVTRFIFALSDGSNYDLEYYNPGTKPTVASEIGEYIYYTSANLEKYWSKFDYELVEKEIEDNRMSMAEAYKDALYIIRETHILPDGVDYGYENIYDISENTFAVYDIDNDDQDELLISYWTTSYGGNVFKIYGYDDMTGKLKEEFSEFPGVTFYSNGVIEARKSHNHGLASMSEEFWPYALYEYRQESDRYMIIADVDAWEKGCREEYEGVLFPEEADTDRDGRLYYIMENDIYEYKNPLDNDVYEKWRESYLKEAEIVSVQFMKMTEENIESISENK